jgi:hypothetical protein
MIVYNYSVSAVKMSGSTVTVLFMELVKIVVYNTILHMLEYHAIKPEEMTTCMKLKILESIRVHHSPPLTSLNSYNSHFSEYRV